MCVGEEEATTKAREESIKIIECRVKTSYTTTMGVHTSGNGVAMHQTNGGMMINKKKKKRSTIKLTLTCIVCTLLVMYIIFVYVIIAKFDHHHNSTGGGSSSSSLRATQQQQLKQPSAEISDNSNNNTQPKKVEPTLQDFCGLCQWRDQGFNCNERIDWVVKTKGQTLDEAKTSNLKYCVNMNGCSDKLNDEGFMDCEGTLDIANPNYKVGTMKHVEKTPELESILSGQQFLDATKKYHADENADSIHNIEGSAKKSKLHTNEEGLRDRRKGEDIVTSVLTAAKYGDRQYESDEGGSKIIHTVSKLTNKDGTDEQEGGRRGRNSDMPILTAYCEQVNQTTWETKPLPTRNGSHTRQTLFQINYPHVNSCKALPSQLPIDTPPVDLDPFLPWIHDVFPSYDGSNVIFVAQNRRRCYNGQRRLRMAEKVPKGVIAHKEYVHLDYGKNYFMRPQAALFQHVPVKKVNVEEETEDGGSSSSEEGEEEPRYRLASHEEADEDGMETRFICRFKSYNPNTTPSSSLSIVGYSLSKHVVDYDYHTYRKGYKFSATEAGYDNHMIWQSQLLFKCPVPHDYIEKVQNGDVVENDYSTLYVDVIPIRTAPRYTPPREFLQPRYDFHNELENLFIPDIEWGKDHILPKINDSGRLENIPICMPSLMSHDIVPKGADVTALTIPENESDKKYVAYTGELPPKIHKVIACTWASTTFRTRSNRAQVDDGKRRLKEWLEFNLLSGFDHIYVYDNSGAFTNEDSLADIIDLFPREKVTRVDWPCKICSNRDGNEGERSSQYAAESSCRLRFGTHARWLGSFDTDEYLVPMGEFGSMGEVADELDKNNVKVAVFKSSPAKPRFDLLE